MNKTNEKQNHIFLTQSELAQEANLKYTLTTSSLLTDIKVLLRDLYIATFSEDKNTLTIAFNNGQKFKIAIIDCQ